MEDIKINNWHTQSVKSVLDSFSVSRSGLSDSEALVRLDEYGKNTIPLKKTDSVFNILLSQFRGPLMIILIVTLSVSLLLSEWLDSSVIGLAILLNVVLGFVEEYKADKSMQKMKKYLPEFANVKRGGILKSIPVDELVPGDIVKYILGDKINADGKVISANNFSVNESALTGESVPVEKNNKEVKVGKNANKTSMIFAGTSVVSGEAEVVITATGVKTEFGKIATLLTGVKDELTPLQKKLAQLAKIISVVVVGSAVIVFLVGILRDFSVIEMYRISVALVISAIPEGLVVAVTVILAIGMQRILKKKSLVKKLVATETLGSVSVICTDKTGTLTTGEMSVEEIVINGKNVDLEDDSLLRGVLFGLQSTNNVVEKKEEEKNKLSGSLTEIGIFKFLKTKNSSAEYGILSKILFDSSKKYSATAVKLNNKKEIFVVGAPEILFKLSDLSDAELIDNTRILKKMTSEGLRVLLVCKRSDLSGVDVNNIKSQDIVDLKVLGFVGLRDPIRKEAFKVIENARKAGLKTIMVTGDNPQTALRIARKAGIFHEGDILILGSDLDEMSDNELDKALSKITIFARVMPKHKVRIVKAWQRKGASVAMTGDGVNDAPAIKAADIGIAFGSGTMVAKEVADLILLDNNFQTIVSAIKEGRIIFDNIRKIIVYFLADSFTEIILIVGALLLSLPLPILPAQILWINLVTDGFPSIGLTFEPGEKGIMRVPPRSKKEPIMNFEMIFLIFVIGIITDIIIFFVYFEMLKNNILIETIRTFIFLAIGIDSLLYVFSVRKLRTSIFRSNPFENKYLVLGVIVGFLFLILPVVFLPLREIFSFTVLTSTQWILVFIMAGIKLTLIETTKDIFHRKKIRV